MSILIIIPARAGSKGLPGKNTKILGDKPLITHSIEFAQKVQQTGDVICISSNDDEVIKIAKENGLTVHFKRPEALASDTASSYDVIMHSINHYHTEGKDFDAVLLLQPTSPFRLVEDYEKLISLFTDDTDMVVTVKETKENPYFTLFEENSEGFLEKSKPSAYSSRQECPKVFAYNGSMYLVKVSSLLAGGFSTFRKVKKVILPEERSIDIDIMQDWVLAEFFLNSK
jgi:CMP-N,N'-diacetyllegionaminic acid synthase